MTATIISIFLGIGLAASTGFRVFVPLLVLSIATHYGYVPVGETFSWIGSIPAIICLLIATVLEVGAYYFPFIDNLLDTISVPLASIAGTIAMAATLVDLDPMLTWGLAIIAGGGTASAISATTAATRAASSIKTAGLANPVVATTEVATASFLSITAITFPVIACIIVLFTIFLLYKLYKKFSLKK
jgi:Domain of unknown function (DUF4126)